MSWFYLLAEETSKLPPEWRKLVTPAAYPHEMAFIFLIMLIGGALAIYGGYVIGQEEKQ